MKKLLLVEILQELKTMHARQLQLGSELNFIKQQNQKIMSKQDELNASLQEINDATTAIAARLQALIDGGADNVTEESLQALQADADALKAIGTPPAPSA